MATYLAFRVASFLLPLLPVRLGYWLATIAGDLTFLLRSRARSNVYANLRHVLGPDVDPKHLRRTARGVFRTGAKNYYDLLRMPALDVSQIDRLVTVHGWEHLQNALAQGRGVIIITAHLGSFEQVMQVLAAKRYPVIVPAEPIKPPRLYDFVNGLRGSHGLRFAPATTGVMRLLVKALRRNEIVGLAIDRDVMGGGLPLAFFGAESTFQPGAAMLARRWGCPVLAAFCTRLYDNRSEAVIEPPIAIQVTDDEEADIKATMANMLSVIERYIRKHPDQWVAFERVWPEEDLAQCSRGAVERL